MCLHSKDDCPVHSQKSSDKDSNDCECKEGYLAENDDKKLTKVLHKGDFCTLAYYSSLIIHDVKLDDIVVTIEIGEFAKQSVDSAENEPIIVHHVGAELDNPVKIILGVNRVIINNGVTGVGPTITILGLKPGKRYNAVVKVRNDGISAPTPVSFPIVPSCSCDALTNPDKTGRPKDLVILQEQGHVMFNFIDNSRCETAFSFTRFSGLPEFTDDSVVSLSFANDYVATSPQPCGATVSPGTISSDDLKTSRLLVGDSYSYCVRSINLDGYMDLAVSDEEERVRMSSTGLCKSHTISWEASIDGRVTTEPNAGSIPIKQVEVTWQIFSVDGIERLNCNSCTGTTSTDEGGRFGIVFNVNHLSLKGTNSADIPVKIKFSKTTTSRDGAIDHIFLCNEGQEVCNADEGLIVYLKHLHFETPVHIYDDTSVPFIGKLIIHGTKFPGADGCPIEGAAVCLQHKVTFGILEDLVCVNSDSNGDYIAPVILGSVINGVKITYHSHTFKRTFENKWNYIKGVRISEGGFYAKNDFMDMSKARMKVQSKYTRTQTHFFCY